jgi:hypothetical protein
MSKKISAIFSLSRFQAGAIGVWLVFKLLGIVNSPKLIYDLANVALVGSVLYVVMLIFNFFNRILERKDPPDYGGYQ